MKIYTDGSALGNGKTSCRAGCGVVFPDFPEKAVSKPVRKGPHGDATNQTAELTAIYEALKIASAEHWSDIQLYTDSAYSIQCLTKWVQGWKRNGWMTAAKKPVIHRAILEEILEMSAFPHTTFIHVRAHTGRSDEHSVWNEKADELARQGALLT